MSDTKALVSSPRNRKDEAKKRLRDQILQSRARLKKEITKNEMLRVELEMIQQEYNVRIGSLYSKDNQLDLEIMYIRNVIHLMNDGFTYPQAVEQLNETYYAKQRLFEREQEQLRNDESMYQKRQESGVVTEDLKKLWKYLIGKFHPDLVQDPKEKSKREEIMKQINLAYEQHDISALQKLRHEVHLDHIEESTIEKLTSILEDIAQQLSEQYRIYRELRESEWYVWRAKIKVSKKNNIDIFEDLEHTLLNDVAKKIKMLNVLRGQLELLKEKTTDKRKKQKSL